MSDGFVLYLQIIGLIAIVAFGMASLIFYGVL